MTSLPDLSDQYSEQIQVGKLALKSYGSLHSIAGEIYTVSCSDDNSVVKDILSREGKNKVLVIDASGVTHASMIGDQIAESAVKNHWVGIVVNGCVRDVEELKNLPIGIFAKGVDRVRGASGGGSARPLELTPPGLLTRRARLQM